MIDPELRRLRAELYETVLDHLHDLTTAMRQPSGDATRRVADRRRLGTELRAMERDLIHYGSPRVARLVVDISLNLLVGGDPEPETVIQAALLMAAEVDAPLTAWQTPA